MGSKPQPGVTYFQPFPTGLGGCEFFRIPSLLCLSGADNNDILFAAADARWNGTLDGYGSDTVFSYSTDGGITWYYDFVNYFGDNGNIADEMSASFIDPSMVIYDNNVLLICDLLPFGCNNNNITSGTGYDADGYLLLDDDYSSDDMKFNGNYRLKGNYIYDNDWNKVDNLIVDNYFNIQGRYNGEDINSNLFFQDSPFKVLRTSYLYLIESNDLGKSWSSPRVLNYQVKKENEAAFYISPGKGLITHSNRIIFPCYSYNSDEDTYASVIYSDDGGITWKRSEHVSDISSEATIAEISFNSNNYLFMITRFGGYYISENDGVSWSEKKNMYVSYNNECYVNVITYSQLSNDRPVICFSAPAYEKIRQHGCIYMGLIDSNMLIEWKLQHSIFKNNGSSFAFFAYSCIEELGDGSLGILCESGDGFITYTKIEKEEFLPMINTQA